MEIFLGTLIIMMACCLALSLGLIFNGKPLPGGCGKQLPGDASCQGCPGRNEHGCSRSNGGGT